MSLQACGCGRICPRNGISLYSMHAVRSFVRSITDTDKEHYNAFKEDY